MTQYYKSVCQWCGRVGSHMPASPSGGTPNCAPSVSGSCPSHPTGKPNMPHAPKWEKE